MGADAFYRWEHRTFPWHFKVHIRGEFRRDLTQELARAWKAPIMGNIRLNKNGGGEGGLGIIRLPKAGWHCPLGLIVHELCHSIVGKKNGRWHGREFRVEYIRRMAEVRRTDLLARCMKRVREKQRRRLEEGIKGARRAARREERKEALKAKRKTLDYRIQRRLDQIVRLKRKIKGLQSRLKTARRSLVALERSKIRKEIEEQNAGAAKDARDGLL